MADKFSGRSKSKTIKIAGVCSLIVIIAVILVFALIPNRLSFFKFNSYFRENDYVRYTVLKEYKNLTQSQDRVLEGVKTGAGYITCTGEDAQKAFDDYVNKQIDYEITKTAMAKYVGSFGVPRTDHYFYMFDFKKTSDAEEFYDLYTGYIMSRKTEYGEEKGYSYSICDSDYHRGCYLERNTVLIFDANPKVYNFEGFCEYMGIRPPSEQKIK